MSQLAVFDGVKASVTQFVAGLTSLQVTDKASNAVAMGALKTIKEMQRQIEAKRVELVDPHNQTVKQINAYAKEIQLPLDQAEAAVKKEMGSFALEESKKLEAERKRIADERRAEEERIAKQRQQEEAERRQKEEAEKKRLEDEAQKRAKVAAAFGAKQDDEAEAKRKLELQQKQERERLEAEAKANRERAEAEMKTRQRERELEAQRNKNTRKVWKFEVTDPAAVPREYLSINESAIRQSVHSGTREIPGVRIYQDVIVTA